LGKKLLLIKRLLFWNRGSIKYTHDFGLKKAAFSYEQCFLAKKFVFQQLFIVEGLMRANDRMREWIMMKQMKIK
jgi:hypothetical protein